MSASLLHADYIRREFAAKTSAERKSALGQFMTPSSVSEFMAGLFANKKFDQYRLLDAGAGVGSLGCAFADRCEKNSLKIPLDHLEVVAYENDPLLIEHLRCNLSYYHQLRSHVHVSDFLDVATEAQPRFTHAILNPPYKKIAAKSPERLLLSSIGIDVPNLYAAFVALALRQLVQGGQLVALIPRSFCNGLYYKAFRKIILQQSAIRHLHLFESRSSAFKADGVLQENMILVLEKGGQQKDVVVSTCKDATFSDLKQHTHAFNQIVFDADTESFIHIPTSNDQGLIERSSQAIYSLDDLGIKVSTGPVVDFRATEYLHQMPVADCVPLLYPIHLHADKVTWPIEGAKKCNAILKNAVTERSMYKNGFYCAVRRFSSKEERRRIMPTLINPSDFAQYDDLAFENHLNVFHAGKVGLPELVARGLVVYLSSNAIDQSFRRFNGHTQVNVTDLRNMRYPSLEILNELGRWSTQQSQFDQVSVDNKMESVL